MKIRLVMRSDDGLMSRDAELTRLGEKIASSLLMNEVAKGEWAVWRVELQVAAELSRGDGGVLTIADEIHQAAHDLVTPAGIHAYAASTLATIPEGAGRPLLRGMLVGQ